MLRRATTWAAGTMVFSGSFCAEETFNSYVDPSMFFYVFPMNSPPAKMNSPTRQPYCRKKVNPTKSYQGKNNNNYNLS